MVLSFLDAPFLVAIHLLVCVEEGDVTAWGRSHIFLSYRVVYMQKTIQELVPTGQFTLVLLPLPDTGSLNLRGPCQQHCWDLGQKRPPLDGCSNINNSEYNILPAFPP